ncbi:MAG: hypothetical protein JNL09_04655, partial [Anaerolineales bacterium]|nr:hypothetical protein [Anaerolineales bacterium]
ASLALMAAVTVQLGQSALRDPLTWALCLLSVVVMVHYKINATWLVLAGALVGLLKLWLAI